MTYKIYPTGAASGAGPGPAGRALWFLTVAAMAASTPVAGSEFASVAEVAANYRFVSADVTPANGWSVVAGTGGNWILIGDELSFAPIGGGADDAPRIIGALNAVGTGGPSPTKIVLRPGPNLTGLGYDTVFHWLTSVEITVDDFWIEATGPDVVIDTDGMPVAPHFAPANAVFQANPYSAAPVTTHLAQTFATGTKQATCVSAAAIPALSYVAIRDQANNRVTTFRVLSKVGNVLTLDRALARTDYLGGAEVVVFVPRQGGMMRGNGARIVSTTAGACGDRVLNFPASWRCTYEGWRTAGVWNEFQQSFDLGGYANVMRDLDIDCLGTGYAGAALESQDSSRMERVRVRNAGLSATGGVQIPDGVNCELVDLEIIDCANHGLSLSINGDASEIYGCQNCTVRGGIFSGNGGAGIAITDGSSGCEVIEAVSFGNVAAGVLVAFGTADTHDNLISGGSYYNNAVNIDVQQSTRNRAVGVLTRHSSLTGVRCALGGQLRVCSSTLIEGVANLNAGMLDQGAANELSFEDSEIDMTAQTAFASTCAVNTSGRLALKNTRVTMNAGVALGVIANVTADVAARVDLVGVTQIGGNGAVLTVAGNNPKVFLGPDCDMRPMFVGTPSQLNTGTIALIAGVGTFPWTPTRADDRPPIVNRISTAQGAVGAGGILVTPNPGVGWVITSISLAGATVATDESSFQVWALS